MAANGEAAWRQEGVMQALILPLLLWTYVSYESRTSPKASFCGALPSLWDTLRGVRRVTGFVFASPLALVMY